MIFTYIPNCEDDFRSKKDINIIKINWNMTNYIAVFSKVLEVYSLASFAFRPAVDWNFTQETKVVVNSGSTFFFFIILFSEY